VRRCKEAVLMQACELLAHLAHFTGNSTFVRHGLVRTMIMTEGVVFLAEAACAHWLTDAIASYQQEPQARAEPFQVWRLVVDAATRHAVLAMTDGNTTIPIITQALDHTDFPLDEITLWLVADGDHSVLTLRSEY
jgi:hypothetical protein